MLRKIDPQKTEHIDFYSHQERLFIDFCVDGVMHRFLLDTGFGGDIRLNIKDECKKSVRKNHELQERLDGSSTRIDTRTIVADARFPHGTFSLPFVVTEDDNVLTMGGLLQISKNHFILLDLSRHEIGLLKSLPLSAPLVSKFVDGVIEIEIRVADQTVFAVLETGCHYDVVAPKTHTSQNDATSPAPVCIGKQTFTAAVRHMEKASKFCIGLPIIKQMRLVLHGGDVWQISG